MQCEWLIAGGLLGKNTSWKCSDKNSNPIAADSIFHHQENVFGLHCSECKIGTFALHAINPGGCIPCFCSGMSEICSEVEDHVRIPVSKAIAIYIYIFQAARI